MDDPNTPTPPAKLTPAQKANWNKFIDFVAANKMSNAPILDQRNKQVGMSLLQKFNMSNPSQALPTDIVPKVQQELQDYRGNLIDQYKAGKVKVDGVKDPEQIMSGISQVDGWPGTRTLSSKFPIATVTTTTPTGTAVKDYGTDLAAYDKDRGIGTK